MRRHGFGTIAASLFAGALAFALSARPPRVAGPPSGPDPGAASRIFEAKCASCHRPEALADRLRLAPEPAKIRKEFMILLQSHGDASPTEVPVVVDWLWSLSGHPVLDTD